jgi:Domain of unknown function (DUF4260)
MKAKYRSREVGRPSLDAIRGTAMTAVTTTMAKKRAGAVARDDLHAVTGMPRVWLRIEGVAALAAGAALYLHLGGPLLWLVPLVLGVDISMVGYVGGPRLGAVVYNLAHNWATGVAVLALALWLGSPPLALLGAILVAHTGMDRAMGYGLKYPGAFADTHLGRLGRAGR